MSGEKKIVVDFDSEGNYTIEAFGFTNGECRKETKSIEDALGKVTARKIKSQDCETVEQKVKA